jgi:hypothetical protein
LSLRAITRERFRTDIERALPPCEGEPCPSVLAGPAHPDLCESCRAAFMRAGIVAVGEQLTLDAGTS